MRCVLPPVFSIFAVAVGSREGSVLGGIHEQKGNGRNNVYTEDGERSSADKLENKGSSVYDFLYTRLKEEADEEPKRKRLAPNIYMIPGPQEPLPGRSHLGDYWPVFPFHNQFSGGLDLDPAISRHIGGDLNIAVPSWGMLDIYGRFFNRIHDTTTKFGYLNYPVNMLDLQKEDFVKLMSDPSLQYNRNAQPRLPLGKLARTYVPLNCKPPMCNPYHASFGFGMEHDYGGNDGVEGDIDVPIPISKGVAYRFPFSGKIYSFWDNITVTYGQNVAPVDPFMSLFEYQKLRDPSLAIPRRRREVSSSEKVWKIEPTSMSYEEHLRLNGKNHALPRFHSQPLSQAYPHQGIEQRFLITDRNLRTNLCYNYYCLRRVLPISYTLTPMFRSHYWFPNLPLILPAKPVAKVPFNSNPFFLL